MVLFFSLNKGAGFCATGAVTAALTLTSEYERVLGRGRNNHRATERGREREREREREGEREGERERM